ncbi:MAG: hypothetical protein H6822_14910 [Planctomycetaceae bacterium]|nr:hypothetical protein [Planctomycetales bacterium]MCB9923470.1 hypothetical protein [Planctomycetaceae bacterium]
MSEFRARAERLFESQRDRVNAFEASITEQLSAIARGAGDPNEGAAASERKGDKAASSEELEEVRNQLTQCRKLLNARASELKQLRGLLSEQTNASDGIDVSSILEQMSELRLERDELIGRLADAERQIDQSNAADAAHFEELQRRFEVAVQEIRELKGKNADLQKQASRPSETTRVANEASTSGFDWEQQKRRMMLELDSELDENDKQVKVSIESTIRITDQVIAEKDRQIADLKAHLEDRMSGQAEDATSILDSDEQIREERERLSRLEDEWRSKLRQAEIDISVERAKLARERSELEAKLRSVEESGSDPSSGKMNSKPSGRWLTRLGLKDDDT